MPTLVCVEPSVSAANCRVTATNQDIIAFPHVDSCMTITVMLGNGTVIGGHVSQFDEDNPATWDATTSIRNFATKMRAMIQGPITKVIFVGANMRKSMPTAHYTLREALIALGAPTDKSLPSFLFIDTCNVDAAFDLFIDLGSRTFTIQTWDKNAQRAELEAPALRPQPLFTGSIDTLSGKYNLAADGSAPMQAVRAGA